MEIKWESFITKSSFYFLDTSYIYTMIFNIKISDNLYLQWKAPTSFSVHKWN